jgi:crotonobetaine/carnitine-CoA ligase
MYSGHDDPNRWVLIQALAEHSARHPDETWVEMTSGESLTFGQAFDDAERVAAWLSSLGIEPGQHVAVMLNNGLDFARIWMGLARLGAVAVLLNTELSGAFLLHPLADCGATIAIVDAALEPVFAAAAVDVAALRRRVVVAESRMGAVYDDTRIAFDDWCNAPRYDGPMPRMQDIACIMYTSGTTGPAKGVLMPHAHCYLYGQGACESYEITRDDAYYITLPLFHANGLMMQFAATLIAACRAIVRPRFSATAWLDDVRRHGATITSCIGVLSPFIIAQPPTPYDRDHRLRLVWNAPNLPEHEAVYRERFGVRDVSSAYGMTEVNIPVWGRLGESLDGAAGRVHDKHYEVMIADPDTDRPVPYGEVGEILVRPKTPFCFMTGYHGRPQQTVDAWRNLWFHTGDAGTMTADGIVNFIDRIKDCIRRRGENISATQIEAAIAMMPGISEVAAYAVPSDIRGGEDEVMLAIVPVPGEAPAAADVAAFAERALPRFARPRFVSIVDTLPKTATGKVQRAVLRKRGAEGAWDLGNG